MANEITVNATLSVVQDHVDKKLTTDGDINFSLDNTTGNYAGGVISVGYASHEAIPVTDITTSGWAWFRNVGDGNYIEIGVAVGATFYPFARLYENEVCLARISADATIYAKSNTAAQYLEYAVFEA